VWADVFSAVHELAVEAIEGGVPTPQVLKYLEKPPLPEERATPPVGPACGSGGGEEDDWLEFTVPETGRPYYYNVRTERSAWERPGGGGKAAEAGTDSDEEDNFTNTGLGGEEHGDDAASVAFSDILSAGAEHGRVGFDGERIARWRWKQGKRRRYRKYRLRKQRKYAKALEKHLQLIEEANQRLEALRESASPRQQPSNLQRAREALRGAGGFAVELAKPSWMVDMEYHGVGVLGNVWVGFLMRFAANQVTSVP
jgi:hypothetical protein